MAICQLISTYFFLFSALYRSNNFLGLEYGTDAFNNAQKKLQESKKFLEQNLALWEELQNKL